MQSVPGNGPPGSSKCAYSVKEICNRWGISKGLLLKEIKMGKLRAKRIGRRRLIVFDVDLELYLAQSGA